MGTRIKLDKKRRTLVVGDVHGCREELENLLRYSGFRRGQDRLVMCGDLIDRGPDPHGVVRLAREYKAVCVLGNHEEKHLRYRRHVTRAEADPKYVIPMRKPHPETHDALTAEDWAYLAQMPLVVDIGDDITVVHGGFSKDIPRWRPTLQACRIRYVNKDTRRFTGSKDGWTQPEATVFWTGVYKGTRNVIYGHQPVNRAEKQYRADGVWTLDLDTGCCFGGALTGYWVGSQSLVSVPAVRRWYDDGTFWKPEAEPVKPAPIRDYGTGKSFDGWDWDWGRLAE
jgi:hypothetical protein